VSLLLPFLLYFLFSFSLNFSLFRRLQYHIPLDYPTFEDIQEIFFSLCSDDVFQLSEDHLKQLCQIPLLSASMISEIVTKLKVAVIKDKIRDSSLPLQITETHWKEVLSSYVPVSSFSQPAFSGNYEFSLGQV
jgi:hypothetical protein